MVDYLVHIVVDDRFGERLKEMAFGEPIWIADSLHNHPVIEEIWRLRKDEGQSDGVTSFKYNDQHTAEQRLIGIFGTVVLHHGSHSHNPPVSVVNIIGATVTDRVEAHLKGYGFGHFSETEAGFVAEITGQQPHSLDTRSRADPIS